MLRKNANETHAKKRKYQKLSIELQHMRLDRIDIVKQATVLLT